MRHERTFHRAEAGGLTKFGLLAAMAGTVFAVLLVVTSSVDVPIAEAARAKVQRMTLAYRDFGKGSPASIFLEKDQGKAHLVPPGGDNSHGPINVNADGTFTVEVDSGDDGVGSNTEIEVNGRKVEIHTSCSKPLGVGFLYGPDGDSTREDPGEFGAGGFNFALEVTALDFDQTSDLGDCLFTPTNTPTPTPSNTPTPTDTPTNTPTPTPTDTPTNTPTPTITSTPTDTPTATPTDTPPVTPTPTNPPEKPKSLVAGCVAKEALPEEVVPEQCKIPVGEQFTIKAISNFAQDFDKDGNAGFHEVSISYHWQPELDPLKQIHFACPPSPKGGTVVPKLIRTDPPTTLICGLDDRSQANSHEMVGETSLSITLTCTRVGIHTVLIETHFLREDKTPVPVEKTFNSRLTLTINCVPDGTPTPTVTGTPPDTSTPTVTGTPPNTSTPTMTGTPPNTSTPTMTGTPPNTSTPTNTPTRTNTPTPTSTPPDICKEFSLGDVNGPKAKPHDERKVNAIDAALILQFSARIIDRLNCPENADVNRDGAINSLDAALILQLQAGLIRRF